MYLLYQIALLGLFLFILPSCLWASYKSGKYRRSMRQRLGILPPELLEQVKQGRWIWVHAVSVGETAAVAPLVMALKKRYPQHQILLSTVTETGWEMARKTLPEIDAHLYFPLDFSFAIRKVLDIITPEVFILAETEIWPNFLHHLKQRRVPVLLVNGRISLSSFKHYKLVKPLMARVLGDIQQFSMQTELDAERIIALGAPKELVKVNGNLKFDQQHSLLNAEERKKLRDELKIPPAAPLLVVGSTHPGEEGIILPVFKQLRREHSDLLMILAPRHPERLPQVESLLLKSEIPFVRKSKLVAGADLKPVILLDTIGELAAIYSLASVVFMGGSLVAIGGHNILEPALYAKAVLFGPSMDNFAEIARLFKEKEAALQVKDGAELGRVLGELLCDAQRRARLGQAAIRVIQENQGATQRNLALVERYLP